MIASKKNIALLLLLLTGFFSCSTDNGLTIPDTVDPDPDADVAAQDFMWKALNFWYFWQEDSPNLADDRFPNTVDGSESYTDFLRSGSDPGDFFDNFLLFGQDRFSYYRVDYRDLVNALSGISKSNGMEFGLISFTGSDAVYGYVRYIVPGSDAAGKAIQRGDLFLGVNGTTLTTSNYRTLLFGDSDTYTLNMADVEGTTVTPNGREVVLTKREGLAENPVFLTKTFDMNGKKIGYLVYNGFTDEYDDDLNRAFGTFRSAAVTDLVLDLRYNPGGSVNTARLLASMVSGTGTDKLFLRKRYNAKVQPYFGDALFFTDKMPDGGALNTLDLDKVYVLTSGSSASASELLINCLAPYMDVIQIGDTTRGKNEFSTTLVDDRDNAYVYNRGRTNRINPEVQWGLQPLIGRNENADGFFDYAQGLSPDIELKEDLANLGILGDLQEPLLARAMQAITGSSKRSFSVAVPIEVLSSSKMFAPLGDNMYDNSPIVLDQLPILGP